MPSTLPISIAMGALPSTVRWTPQQLADAMVARMSLVTSQTYALFVTGSTAPSSNVGPWLKNGTEWFVWSDSEGGYIPQIIAPESLGYWIGPDAPDPDTFNFWIQTDGSGSPLAVKIFYSGSWVDVYAAQLASYLTIAAAAATYAPLASPALTGVPTAPTAAPGTDDTQIATTAFATDVASTEAAAAEAAAVATANTYTDAAIGAIPGAMNPVPGAGRLNVAQNILADGSAVVMTIDSAPINADGAISIADNAYVAPANGTYHFDVWSQFDNDDAVAADVEIQLGLYVNNVSVNQGDQDGTPAPNGDRWSPGFSGLISLASGDKVTCKASIGDGVGTNHVDLTTWQIAMFRVK